MDDGAKEDPAKFEEPKFLGKAGWLKRVTGRLFASYKDLYIHVEKTEVVVYENKDLQNCLERIDLENYDRCQEVKSPFKKKHRLILIQSHKSGCKVNNVKFQTQSSEEKEAWMKALSDGINRAKNKVFDEVKVDESCNLEHVTRTRPKGNRNRRPPTRIHMKQVDPMSPDGVLHLDSDLEDALMPNGTHHPSFDGTETPKEDETGATPEGEPDRIDVLMKKVLKPPMPPSKEAKPCVTSVEEATEKAITEKMCVECSDTKKKIDASPTLPNKCSSSSSMSNLAEASQSNPNSRPPTPPPKEKKPSHPAVEPDQEVEVTTGEIEEALPTVRHDEPESPRAEGSFFEEESAETRSTYINRLSDNKPQTPTEPPRMSPSPPLTPKEKAEECIPPDTHHIEDKKAETQPTEGQEPTVLLQAASDTSGSSPQVERGPPESNVPSVAVFVNDQVTDSLSLSPVLCLLQGEKKKKGEEEKSVDSGQHSDDDSEDTLGASTAALRGSHAVLDVSDASEDNTQISVNLRKTQAIRKSHVRSEVFPYQHSPPVKPASKARSASSGDLLSDSSVCIHGRKNTRAVAGNDRASSDDVIKLEAELSLEMEETSELLSRVAQSQGPVDGEGRPENLLAKAIEKLKKADHVLREVKKLKPAKNSSNRKSW